MKRLVLAAVMGLTGCDHPVVRATSLPLHCSDHGVTVVESGTITITIFWTRMDDGRDQDK